MQIKNIDTDFKEVFEPIQFVLDGETYTVDNIDAEVLENMSDAKEDLKSIRRGLASLTNTDIKQFAKTDFRKMSMALGFVTQAVAAQTDKLKAKNVQGESVE